MFGVFKPGREPTANASSTTVFVQKERRSEL